MTEKNIAVKSKNKDMENEAIAIARLKYLRIAPRKVRLVADLIRNMSANEAEAQLVMSSKRPSKDILKLLRSCMANAKSKGMNENKLFIDSIYVDEGPTLKRWIPRARGMATPINKRTSHITVVLKERDKEQKNRYVISNEKVKDKKLKKKMREEKEIKDKNDNKVGDVLELDDKKEKKKMKEKERELKKSNKEEIKAKQNDKKGGIKKLFRRKSI